MRYDLIALSKEAYDKTSLPDSQHGNGRINDPETAGIETQPTDEEPTESTFDGEALLREQPSATMSEMGPSPALRRFTHWLTGKGQRA